MNKKHVDTTAIENELEGASLFFPTTDKSKNHTRPTEEAKETGYKQGSDLSPKDAGSDNKTPQPPVAQKSIEEIQIPKGAGTDTVSTDTMTLSNHDTMVSRHDDTTTPSMVESIRKAVKLVGKEAATHRFTPEEKAAIADIIYTYRRQGFDSSENEIARIAINWLVADHQQNKEESVLAHVLRALKE